MDPAVRRRRVVTILVSAAAMPVVAALAYLFAPATSFSAAALGHSVAGEASDNRDFESSPCSRRRAGGWACEARDPAASASVTYRVEMDDSRCWHGRRTSPGHDEDGKPLPRRISGCLKLRDQLRLWERLFQASLPF